MDLTVIILSYNVRYLLESCLESVENAIRQIQGEIIVVDNASSDESVDMVRTRFPGVRILANDQNTGFAKANNLAIREASGKYVLILNPDTLVQEGAIKACLAYLETHGEVAAAGVRMTDSAGRFLRESKRGFPGLWPSIWKLSGFSRIMPGHPKINHYYLGHLNEEGIHPVEILTGAFMMVKKKILEQVGGFDERFFMYGEDIDLSFRIRQLGYGLIYLGDQAIVHLKGRSSSVHSTAYVRNFYKAMSIFVKKYYFNPVLKTLVMAGIGLAAMISWLKRKIVRHFLPLMDILLLLFILFLVQYLWAEWWFGDPAYFRHTAFMLNAASYVILWFMALIFMESYRPYQEKPGLVALKAILAGTLVILILYSLLPEKGRTSRAVILLSGLLAALILPWTRTLLRPGLTALRALYTGDRSGEQTLNPLFKKLCHDHYFSYLTREDLTNRQKPETRLAKLNDLVQAQGITHVILESPVKWKEDLLLFTYGLRGKVKFLVPDKNGVPKTGIMDSIPGLKEAEVRLSKPIYKITKSVLNLLFTVLILPWGWLRSDIRKNYFTLLLGSKQWISYHEPPESNLPSQRPGLWHPGIDPEPGDDFPWQDLNFEYAGNYNPGRDILIVLARLFNFK